VDDLRVRKALNLAVNRQAIVDILLEGIERAQAKYGLKAALRCTPNDNREFLRPPLMRSGRYWEAMLELFERSAAAGVDFLSIESVGGKELHDDALVMGDISAVIFSLCILGGYVYQGWRLPELTDRYIFSDHGSGNVWALEYGTGAPVSTLLVDGDNYSFTSLGVDTAGEIYVLSLLDKVYRLTRDDAVPAPILPSGIHLELPRPNPFNPSTQLRYRLDEAAEATLTVYDVAGRRVRGLASGIQAAGEHTATWNGRDDDGLEVASGVYLVELRSGPHTARTRVVLSK